MPPPPQQPADVKETEPKKPTSTDAGAEASAPAKTQTRSDRKQSAVLDALADPDIHIGRKSCRSFYIDDEAFARFRAAIHWSSRRLDATDAVPHVLNPLSRNVICIVSIRNGSDLGDMMGPIFRAATYSAASFSSLARSGCASRGAFSGYSFHSAASTPSRLVILSLRSGMWVRP